MSVSRRMFFGLGLAGFGLATAGGYSAYRSLWRPSPYEASLAIWLDRFRPHLSLAPVAATHFASREEAEKFLQREIQVNSTGNTLENWVNAFETARDREFTKGETIYLDGWPFAPVEAALISLVFLK